jgi:hypothetical protein
MAAETKPATSLDFVRDHHGPTAEAFAALRKAVMSSGPLPAPMQELIVCPRSMDLPGSSLPGAPV